MSLLCLGSDHSNFPAQALDGQNVQTCMRPDIVPDTAVYQKLRGALSDHRWDFLVTVAKIRAGLLYEFCDVSSVGALLLCADSMQCTGSC